MSAFISLFFLFVFLFGFFCVVAPADWMYRTFALYIKRGKPFIVKGNGLTKAIGIHITKGMCAAELVLFACAYVRLAITNDV